MAKRKHRDRDRDPKIIYSKHSGPYADKGHVVDVHIYRTEIHKEWALEVVDKAGTSTVWDDQFASDDEAWLVFLKTMEEEGIESVVGPVENRQVH